NCGGWAIVVEDAVLDRHLSGQGRAGVAGLGCSGDIANLEAAVLEVLDDAVPQLIVTAATDEHPGVGAVVHAGLLVGADHGQVAVGWEVARGSLEIELAVVRLDPARVAARLRSMAVLNGDAVLQRTGEAELRVEVVVSGSSGKERMMIARAANPLDRVIVAGNRGEEVERRGRADRVERDVVQLVVGREDLTAELHPNVLHDAAGVVGNAAAEGERDAFCSTLACWTVDGRLAEELEAAPVARIAHPRRVAARHDDRLGCGALCVDVRAGQEDQRRGIGATGQRVDDAALLDRDDWGVWQRRARVITDEYGTGERD